MGNEEPKKVNKNDDEFSKNRMIEEENNKILKGDYRDRFKVKNVNPLDFYDMIIDIDSFSKTPDIIWNIETKPDNKNIPVKKNEEIIENKDKNAEIINNDINNKKDKFQNKEEIEIKKNEENNIVIGVIGLGNVGKSYLLSLFTEEELPTGYSIHTKGISIKKCKKLIILDSEGMESPLTKNNISEDLYKNNELVEREINESDSLIQKIARDKKAVELFIQDFIIEKSNILIIVVGQLTLTEQKLINRITRDTNKDTIIVIHNLKDLYTKDQISKYIENTFKKNMFFNNITERDYMKSESYDEKENTVKKNIELFGKYFMDKSEDFKNKRIIHLIMASNLKESEAIYYNRTAFDFVKEEILAYNNGRKFNILNELQKFLIKKAGRFAESKEPNKLPFSKEDISLEEKENKKYIKIKNNIRLKKCLINQLGFSAFYGILFSPNYVCYIEKNKEKKEQKFIIEINACSDLFEFDPPKREEITDDNHKIIITITGKKKLKSHNKIIETLECSTMDSGNFRIDIILDGKKFKFKKEKVKKKTDNGLYKLIYSLFSEEDFGNEEAKDIEFKIIENKNKVKKKKKEDIENNK